MKMTALKSVAPVAGRDAALIRCSDDDPKLIAARQQLKALSPEEHIQKTVSAWPALTTNQKILLSGLFQAAGSELS